MISSHPNSFGGCRIPAPAYGSGATVPSSCPRAYGRRVSRRPGIIVLLDAHGRLRSTCGPRRHLLRWLPTTSDRPFISLSVAPPIDRRTRPPASALLQL
nr:unnamed protein product [Digitaria exilis]